MVPHHLQADAGCWTSHRKGQGQFPTHMESQVERIQTDYSGSVCSGGDSANKHWLMIGTPADGHIWDVSPEDHLTTVYCIRGAHEGAASADFELGWLRLNERLVFVLYPWSPLRTR